VNSASYVAASNASAKGQASPAFELDLRSPSRATRLWTYLRGALVVAEVEVRKLRHDPTELLTRAIQPALWLVIFGKAFSKVRVLPTGNVDYLTFMTPGILAQSLMFISIFYGLTIIWDRDQGLLQKVLVMPVPRASFVTGKGLGAGIRALSQALAIFVLALLLGVHLRWTVGGIVGSLLTVVLGASFFATLSMLIAIMVKTRERFMGMGQVLTMPLFFASNAIYPIAIMPSWLKVLSTVNPLTYIVNLLRGYLVTGQISSPITDWTVLIVALLVAQIIAGRTYHRIMI
jgi:ABC-2 type transport system permease protein